ncbi:MULTISPECIES: hypothetical protein [Acinetobacter]|uniref:Terminase small subunit n=1 Tax=Acinetobacter tianfuensis TaxID=2419603 RepID=A0A3A8EGQ4_9GAMM|nr:MULTISPECIES: hypothetical protein [Acinetobacter]MCU4488976.1 hypothetical protein [Acinetobacter ursingii]MDD4852083.1 hypothetical protein [Acinetobacter towneri]RKG33745.1 hypothetical protein D7V32_02795 [Acinetobacter tianfuensis]
MTEKRQKIDYDRIERGWRAGILSPRQLAAAYEEETGQKVSHAAIIKHFTKLGIPRNLAEKIKAKSDAMVTQAMVTEQVTPVTIKRDQEIIEDAATQLTYVRLNQRKDIQRSRKIAMSLFDELEMMVGQENVKLLEMLGELMWSPDDKGNDKVNDLYMKIISMPGRVKSMKDLSDTLKTLIALERQAFGLDDENNKPVDALTALLERVSTGNSSAFKPIADDPEY